MLTGRRSSALTSSPDRPVAARWGHLEIRAEIGRGASGTVYRAWDPKLAREVALKLLAPDALDSTDALREGRLLARLNHPHIVRVFGAGNHDGASGIWMELLEGETLDEVLERDGVVGAEEALLIGLDLARALAAVHAAGLLHRDVKARNVLRERRGRIVLMDLGAGHLAADAHGDGGGAGTPMYMAPEVLAGGAATVQSDIYSLGVLIYRLLTSGYPVPAADVAELRSAHAARARVPLAALRRDMPAPAALVIERACDPDPGARHESSAELETALTAALQHTLADRAATSSSVRRAWIRWRKTIRIAVTTCAVIVGAGWASWDTGWGRGVRRAIGLQVLPRSALYLTMNGAVGIVHGGRVTIVPFNPATASTMAVSEELGIRTTAATPPWTTGGAFALDGRPLAAPSKPNTMCCWMDGTTDGEFNYAIRQDSTLLEPIGSRPLAPPAVYRFGRDWSNPQLHFPLEPHGLYQGITYSARSSSFWVTRTGNDTGLVEQWNRDGTRISTPVSVAGASFRGIAADPLDGTLWVVRAQGGTTRLENFEASGRHLFSVDTLSLHPFLDGIGVEFAWIKRP